MKMSLSAVILLILTVLLATPQIVQAQGEDSGDRSINGVVKLSPLGAIVNTLKSPTTFNNYAIRFCGEYALNDQGSINMSLDIGLPDFGRKFIYIRPEYRHYIVGNVLDGFYIGGFFQYGNIASSVHHIGAGASTGYQMAFVNNWLILDLNLQLGYGGILSNGSARNGLLLFPSAGIGVGL
jgi:hypothetical protein